MALTLVSKSKQKPASMLSAATELNQKWADKTIAEINKINPILSIGIIKLKKKDGSISSDSSGNPYLYAAIELKDKIIRLPFSTTFDMSHLQTDDLADCRIYRRNSRKRDASTGEFVEGPDEATGAEVYVFGNPSALDYEYEAIIGEKPTVSAS